jgi:hypothetical protein
MGKKDKLNQSADATVEGTPSAASAEKPAKQKKDKGGSSNANAIAEPSAGGQFTAKDHIGALLLILPKAIEEDIATVHGPGTAIRVDLVVIDEKDPSKSEAIDDTLIFQKVLQGQLRSNIGKSRVCGRLFLDESSKKAGQSAPYKLAPPTKAEINLAGEYLDSIDPLR